MYSIKHKEQSEEIASQRHLLGTGDIKNSHATKLIEETFIQIMNTHGIHS